jgi:hypothetical protein
MEQNEIYGAFVTFGRESISYTVFCGQPELMRLLVRRTYTGEESIHITEINVK